MSSQQLVHAKQWRDRKGRNVTSFEAWNQKCRVLPRSPFKATFTMRSPIAVTDYIHFDALVWHAALEEQLGPAFWTQTGHENYDLLVPLQPVTHVFTREGVVHRETGEPLRITRKYSSASVGTYPNGFVEGVTAWRKRCDFPTSYGKVDTARGMYKAFDTPLAYISTPKIVFYAVGNKPEVERLLKTRISHVGKKRSQGYGRIGEITVEDCAVDYSVFRDDVLQRPIPASGCPWGFADPVEAYYAYKPPYWRRGNLTPCFMPGSVRLSNVQRGQVMDNREKLTVPP